MNSSNIKKIKLKKILIHKMCFKILSIILAVTAMSSGLLVRHFVSAVNAREDSVQSAVVRNTPSSKSTSLGKLASWLCTTTLAWVQSNAQVLAVSGCVVTFNILKITSISNAIKELKQKITNLESDIEKNKRKVLSEITVGKISETAESMPPPSPLPSSQFSTTPMKSCVSTSKVTKSSRTPRGNTPRPNIFKISPGRLRSVKLKNVPRTVNGITVSPSVMSKARKKQREIEIDPADIESQLRQAINKKFFGTDPEKTDKK